MVINVLCFPSLPISPISRSAQESECFYKNITISSLLMRLTFFIVELILNLVKYFSTKSAYSFYSFTLRPKNVPKKKSSRLMG